MCLRGRKDVYALTRLSPCLFYHPVLGVAQLTIDAEWWQTIYGGTHAARMIASMIARTLLLLTDTQSINRQKSPRGAQKAFQQIDANHSRTTHNPTEKGGKS